MRIGDWSSDVFSSDLHGNGTQDVFYEDDTVLVFDTHHRRRDEADHRWVGRRLWHGRGRRRYRRGPDDRRGRPERHPPRRAHRQMGRATGGKRVWQAGWVPGVAGQLKKNKNKKI